MPFARPALLALAASVGPWAVALQDGVQPILEIKFEGGTLEDREYAAAAFGLQAGEQTDAALRLAMESVRATDRFHEVRSIVEDLAGGKRLRVLLAPWPSITTWSWAGDPLEARLRKQLFLELHRGARPGAIRLEAMRLRAEQKLRDTGHPQARATAARVNGTGKVVLGVQLGRPALIEKVEWDGDFAPYSKERILAAAGIKPGQTLWTAGLRREALAGLRKRFLADHRYEWQAELSWKEDGLLRARVNPGPKVQIIFAGDRIRWTGVRDLLPFVWADRYSTDLLEQGDRRILLYLNGAGYKDAQVSHRREILQGAGSGKGEIRITYTVQKGLKASLDGLVFERNRELSSEELTRAAQVPRGMLGFGSPAAIPEVVDAVVERVKACYFRRGFTEVSLRRRLETQGGRTRLIIQVKEGERRFIESLELQIPAGAAWDATSLQDVLFSVLGERSFPIAAPQASRLARRAERPEMGGAVGVLEDLTLGSGAALRRVKLALDRPIPFVKTDLALMLALLRQRISQLGTPRPLFPKLNREEGDRGERITVEIIDQPLFKVRRLVVQGTDETKPEAVLREAALTAGLPLDPGRLISAQAQVGNLGAFERVDLVPLAEAPYPEPRPAWKEGDLLLRLQERPHWIFSSGFGYDRNSGYHFLFGVQRLNFQGLGRTVDLNLRAGDATLNNPGLRNFFPTGSFRRSVDIYSLGYSDPRFAPGSIASWLPERTEYRAEAAYLDEVQSSFEIRRRRVLNGLQWKPVRGTEIRLGHRFERVEVNSIIYGLSNDELNALTKTPGRVVISAPYLQYTRDRRDNPFDPTDGTFFFGKLEFANQVWGTSRNASFVKLDFRQQWNWPLGYRAARGVVSIGARIGLARPTASSSEDLPLSERFFAGGPGSNRGVEPDFLGPITSVPLIDPATRQVLVKNGFRQYYLVPTGGQGLAIVNLEYRFPITPSVWLEVFLDSGQVYASLDPPAGTDTPFPPWRTSLGAGLILKLGIPLKLEYGADIRRIFGKPRTAIERQTQLKNLLISAGFQF